jgi:type II pantothenate kinase
MAVLTQLADPEHYQPCAWDLKADPTGRQYWTDLFRWHLDDVVVPLVREMFPAATAAQIKALSQDYRSAFEAIDRSPGAYDRLDILVFTKLRRAVLCRHGFEDPFRGVKERANEAAIALLPTVLGEIDAAPPARQHELLTLGLLAGNVFDLGSRATADRHDDANAAFRQTRDSQPPRPWRWDDADRWWSRWQADGAYRHVVMFVDNAGGDILLGCLPLARWMVRQGARVTLAANSAPALNDITARELDVLLARCRALDAPLSDALDSGRLQVRATGSVSPLLDLADLGESFVAATAEADALVLHGMGRAIESNFSAPFRCDVLRTAVLKDEAVAGFVGGGLFDRVFRLDGG